MKAPSLVAEISLVVAVTLGTSVLISEKAASYTGGAGLAAIFIRRRFYPSTSDQSEHTVTPISDLKFLCHHCGTEFATKIPFKSLEELHKTSAAGHTQTCPSCKRGVRCSESNAKYTRLAHPKASK